MTEVRKTIKLYDALELRGEYDARIKTLRDCLPEAHQNRDLFSHRDNDSSRRPAPGFSIPEARPVVDPRIQTPRSSVPTLSTALSMGATT